MTANVTGAFPILTVSDMGRALRFYLELLGGRQTYRFPEEGEPAFVTLELGGCLLGLGQEADLPPPADGRPRIELCAYAADCDAAVAALREAGVTDHRRARRPGLGRADGAGGRPRRQPRHHPLPDQ